MRLSAIVLLSVLLATERVAETAEWVTVGTDSAIAYVLNHRKANGAFGPAGHTCRTDDVTATGHIAEDATHADLLNAAAAGRFVRAIVADAASCSELELCGPTAASAYCQHHPAKWQWWPEQIGQQAPSN
jgi:hypothetical protein